MFAVYLLSDRNGPPTAFLLFRPQCAVGVLAGTHWGALRCPSTMASGTKRQPLSAALLHCCWTAELVLARATKHTPSVEHTRRGFWPTWIAPKTVFVSFTLFMTSWCTRRCLQQRWQPSALQACSFRLHHPDRTRSSLWIPASFHRTPCACLSWVRWCGTGTSVTPQTTH